MKKSEIVVWFHENFSIFLEKFKLFQNKNEYMPCSSDEHRFEILTVNTMEGKAVLFCKRCGKTNKIDF